MNFNNSANFNREFFNRNANIQLVLSGITGLAFATSTDALHAQAAYGEAGSSLVYGIDADNWIGDRPFGDAESGLEYDTSASLLAEVFFFDATAGIQYDLETDALRVNNDSSIYLTGLTFRPGDTIIIDTDSLDILINGEPDVTSWVVGSDFFQLGKGENTIAFVDNAIRRTLSVTIVWADRWL